MTHATARVNGLVLYKKNKVYDIQTPTPTTKQTCVTQFNQHNKS